LVHNGYPDLRHRINGWLDKNSRLYVWQKDRTLKLKQAKQKEVRAEELGPSPYAWHGAEIRNSEWIYYTGEHEEADYSWAVTRAEILQFAKEVRADGAIFGVFVMPHNLQLNDDTFEFVRGLAGELGPQFDSRNPNRRIAEICAEADIVFHDPLDRFRAATPSHSSLAEDELLHYQGEHMNEKGHALTAEMLYDWLTQYDWENAAAR